MSAVPGKPFGRTEEREDRHTAVQKAALMAEAWEWSWLYEAREVEPSLTDDEIADIMFNDQLHRYDGEGESKLDPELGWIPTDGS